MCTRYCCKSLNKQSSGVQERINPFYINSYGENIFGLRTFRFTNDLEERIKFVNRGLTLYLLVTVRADVMQTQGTGLVAMADPVDTSAYVRV